MFIWAVIIIIAVWLIVRNNKANKAIVDTLVLPSKESNLSDEAVFKAQHNFDKKLQDEVGFPDSIGRTDRYIYRNFMSVWFRELSGKYRYDEKMLQKIRHDFVDYMYETQNGTTANYLSFELENKEEQEEYSKEATISGRKAYAIQDAFAAAIGGDAKEKLEKARQLGWNDLNRFGEQAPEGFHYDLEDQLKPNKKKENSS